ncbi:hydrogenase [candidate division GN15 bacterium]|uniref:Hydrogenase n=1 Tax=candidate division GN15 bacterium TaxID=2072418 RepID=A0A855X444_9BACT|nr:MAG: hydrogenase [candidate division GN15 bacterium]
MSTIVLSSLHIVLPLLAAPLLPGIINRTKAILAGRRGQPVLQGYFDLLKLVRKGAVYSRTTTWLFRAGPIVNLVTIAMGLLLVPFGGSKALFGFDGDLILFAYLLGLGRFFVVAAALDTGSSFEGMGASREVTFSMLAEPTLFIGLFALSRLSGSMSLSGILYSTGVTGWSVGAPVLVSGAFFMIYLSENARIPVDDPATHLELTMIHEVMVLDHGGPDFALVSYGAALKLWLLGMLLVGVFSPNLAEAPLWFREGYALLGMFVLSVGVGVVESLMARVRLLKVPQLLIGAGALSVLAVILVLE